MTGRARFAEPADFSFSSDGRRQAHPIHLLLEIEEPEKLCSGNFCRDIAGREVHESMFYE